MDGGPNNKGKEVTYAQVRTTLQDFLLDHSISKTSAKDAIAAYTLDVNATSGSSVDDEPQVEKASMTKPTKTADVKKACATRVQMMNAPSMARKSPKQS
jgi:hypothetical protein